MSASIPERDGGSKPPPHSKEAEQAVLGSLLRDNAVALAVQENVRAEHFHRDAHQIIYRAITGLLAEGAPADLVTVYSRLSEKGQLGDMGGQDYLAELWDAAPTAANAGYYAKTVRERFNRRQLIHLGNKVARDAADGVAPPGELVELFQNRLDDLAADAPAICGQQWKWRPMSAAALAAATYQREFLIERLLVRKQPAVCGGPRKSLKTSTLADLCVSLASGTNFLGYFRVPAPLRVGFFSAESGEATLQETLFRVCRSRGLELADLADNLRVQFDLPKLSNTKDLAALQRGLERDEIDVVILDPLYLALLAGQGAGGAQASSLFDMGPLYAGIAQACLGAGATPILVCHTQRAAARSFEPCELDDLAFAGVAEFARQWLLLSRREKYQPGTGQHKLWLNVGGSAGHGGLWAADVNEGAIDANFQGRTWDVTVNTATETRAAVQDDKRVAREQKESAQDAEDDAALLRAIDALDQDGIGASYNRVQVEGRLSDARMSRAVTRLTAAQAIQEHKVEAEIGSGAKRNVRGLRRVPAETQPCIPFPGR